MSRRGLPLSRPRPCPIATEFYLLSSGPHPRTRGAEGNLLSKEWQTPATGWGLLSRGEHSRDEEGSHQSPKLQLKTQTGRRLGVETTVVVRELGHWEKTVKIRKSEAETSRKRKGYPQIDLTPSRPATVEETTDRNELTPRLVTSEEPLRTSDEIFRQSGRVPGRRVLGTVRPLEEEGRPSPDKSEVSLRTSTRYLNRLDARLKDIRLKRNWETSDRLDRKELNAYVDGLTQLKPCLLL